MIFILIDNLLGLLYFSFYKNIVVDKKRKKQKQTTLTFQYVYVILILSICIIGREENTKYKDKKKLIYSIIKHILLTFYIIGINEKNTKIFTQIFSLNVPLALRLYSK